MFKVTIGTPDGGVLHTTVAHKTVKAALTAAAGVVRTTDDEKVRVGLRERSLDGHWSEILWAWGTGLKDAIAQVRKMDARSRRGGGR